MLGRVLTGIFRFNRKTVIVAVIAGIVASFLEELLTGRLIVSVTAGLLLATCVLAGSRTALVASLHAERDLHWAGRDLYSARIMYLTVKNSMSKPARGSTAMVLASAFLALWGTLYFGTQPAPHAGGGLPGAGNPPSASGRSVNQSGRGRGVAAVQWPSFLIPGTVVMCQDGTNVGPGKGFTLSAISMTTGQAVASRTFSLPSWAAAGYDCDGPGLTSAVPARQMFNRSFTSIAVTEARTDGDFATVVNLQNGRAAPVPTPSGFTSQPRQGGPQFDPVTQEVWYADAATDQIGVFDPASGRDTVKEQTYASAVAAENGSYWPVDGYNWAVSPDGRHIAIAENNGDFAMYFADAGVAVSDGVGIDTNNSGVETFGGDSSSTSVVPGSDSVNCSAPAAWVDDTHLLCYEQEMYTTNIALITFEPGGNSVATFQADLLPSTDRTNASLVVAPDGKSFAFLSLDGTTLSLYRDSLAPHSTPVKISDISTDDSTQYLPFLLQWN